MLYLHRISSRYPTCTYHYRVLQGGITSVAFDIKVIIIVLVNVQFVFSSSCSFGHFILWTLFHRKPNLLRFWFYLSASETKWTKSLDVVTLLAKVNASVSLTPLAFDLPTRWSQEKYFKEFSYYVCILEGIVALNFIHNSYVQQCSTVTKTRTAKMQGYKWNFGLVIIAIALQVSVAAPNVRTKRQDIADIPDMDDLNPIEVEASKNTAYASADASRLRRVVEKNITGDDVPEFDRTKVSLDIPDELFSSSFRTVTNFSKSIGNLIMNSARRYAQFVRYFKPVLGATLEVKGYEPTTSTTEASTTTSGSNEI